MNSNDPHRKISGQLVAGSQAASPSAVLSPRAVPYSSKAAENHDSGVISPATSLSPVGMAPMIHSKLYGQRRRRSSRNLRPPQSTTLASQTGDNSPNSSTPSFGPAAGAPAAAPSATSITAGMSALTCADTATGTARSTSTGSPAIKPVRSHAELAQTANGVRMLAKNLTRATIQLDVRSIMIVTKAKDNSLVALTRELVQWLLGHRRDIAVYVDKGLEKLARFNAQELVDGMDRAHTNLRFWDKSFATANPEIFDLVLTLGGDGTVLFVLNLFQRIVPPVISFALGLLGFLTNFQFEEFPQHMEKVLERGVRANLRMRFTCRVHRGGKLASEHQVLNELVVDRGPLPYVTNLELYGDGSLLTVAQADGLIIATPTGSTAYSLSAGGLLVHPGVSAISVTPICPHTLSFRPILLPDGMVLKVRVPPTSRSTAWASFDGKVRSELRKGDYVTIRASPYPFPTVILSKTEYIDSVSRNLQWNVRDLQKPFTHMLSEENKQLFEGHSHQDVQFDIDYSDDETDSSQCNVPAHDHDLFGADRDPGTETAELSEADYDDRPCFAHPNAKITLRHL